MRNPIRLSGLAWLACLVGSIGVVAGCGNEILGPNGVADVKPDLAGVEEPKRDMTLVEEPRRDMTVVEEPRRDLSVGDCDPGRLVWRPARRRSRHLPSSMRNSWSPIRT